MAGRELTSGLMAASEVSRSSNSAAAAPPALSSSRAVGHTGSCVLLILGVGFLLIFSYQSEIHTVVLAHGRAHTYGSLAAIADSSSGGGSVVRKPIKPVRLHPEAKSTRGRGESGGKGELHFSATQRRLESQDTNSSSNVTSASSPPPPKKKNWKDIKVEAYMPLVESVHSNVVSSKFQLVIKVLSVNDYSSLPRCLYSLSKAEYAGDSVDIHIYIDHFEISESDRRRLLLAEEGTQTAEVKPSEDDVVDAKEETEKATPSNSKAERIKRMRGKTTLKSSRASTTRKLEADSSSDNPRPTQLPDRVSTGVDPVKLNDWGQVDQRLDDARKVLNHVEYFQWKHGKKVIHYRTSAAGSQSQWLDAWWPSSDDEFALFVEDDVEVSPLYYRYARALIATYYYQPSQYDRLLYGISLQRPQIVPGKNGQPLKVDDRTRLFKYQMIGTWGQIFFPKPWKEFRQWYDHKKSHDVKPIVDGMVTTDWYYEHGEKIFTPWFVKFAYSRGYFNLYTNFLRDRVLSVTHRGGTPKQNAGCDSVLIWNNGTYDIDLWHMAANWDIKRYDYCFKEVRVGRFANYTSDVGWVLDSTQKNKQILMVSTVGVPEVLVRNWLCSIKKLGIDNYVLVGEDPVLLEDLSRRGHATVRIDNKLNLKESIEKEVSAVSDLLALGYTVWFTRADTIWGGNPISLINTNEVDVIGVERSELNLLFIRSTEKTTQLWGSLKEDLLKVPANVSRAANWERAREKFINSCQGEEGQVQVRKLDRVVFTDGEQLSQPPSLETGQDSADGQVFVFSGLRSSEDWQIKNRLRDLRLLNVDDDLVCSTLTC
ncbi:unnamed protein product [Calypogeia fissa]